MGGEKPRASLSLSYETSAWDHKWSGPASSSAPGHVRTRSSPSGLLEDASSSSSPTAGAVSPTAAASPAGASDSAAAAATAAGPPRFADFSRDKLHFAHQDLLVARKPLLREEELASQVLRSGSFRKRKVRTEILRGGSHQGPESEYADSQFGGNAPDFLFFLAGHQNSHRERDLQRGEVLRGVPAIPRLGEKATFAKQSF